MSGPQRLFQIWELDLFFPLQWVCVPSCAHLCVYISAHGEQLARPSFPAALPALNSSLAIGHNPVGHSPLCQIVTIQPNPQNHLTCSFLIFLVLPPLCSLIFYESLYFCSAGCLCGLFHAVWIWIVEVPPEALRTRSQWWLVSLIPVRPAHGRHAKPCSHWTVSRERKKGNGPHNSTGDHRRSINIFSTKECSLWGHVCMVMALIHGIVWEELSLFY